MRVANMVCSLPDRHALRAWRDGGVRMSSGSGVSGAVRRQQQWHARRGLQQGWLLRALLRKSAPQLTTSNYTSYHVQEAHGAVLEVDGWRWNPQLMSWVAMLKHICPQKKQS